MLELYYELVGYKERDLVYQCIGIKFGEASLLYEYNYENIILGVSYFSNYEEMLNDNLQITKEIIINKREIVSEWFNQGITT